MAVRTSSSAARSSSHSTQRAPQKSSSAQRPTSSSKPSTSSQTKQAVSAPKRDTFTYSSPTAKQTAPKTSTAKTSTAPKTTQTKTSTTKTNTAAKTNSTKTTKSKSTSTASNKNRDTFTYTSPAAKTAVKNNASNKTAVSGSLSKNKTKYVQNTVPDGLKLHLKHTTDPKQKAAMQKTMKNISNGISSEKEDETSKRLKELGIDLTTLHTATTDIGTVFELTKAKAYTVVPNGDTLIFTGQALTENDFQRIVNIMTHEAGSSANADSEMFGIASVVLNEYEHDGFYDYGNYSKDTFADFLDGFYKVNSNLSTGGGLNIASGITSADETWKHAEEILKFTLEGNHAFGSETCYWVGNSSGKYAGRVSGFSTHERGVVDTTGGVKGIDY